MSSTTLAAAPQLDLDNAFFWEGLAQGRFLVQRCTSCGRVRFPPTPGCPGCGEVGSEAVASSGEGSVYSWVVVHRAFSPAFADDVPYTVATIELDEGCRVLARLELASAEPSFGMRVRVDYRERRREDGAEWTEAFFRSAAQEKGS